MTSNRVIIMMDYQVFTTSIEINLFARRNNISSWAAFVYSVPKYLLCKQ